MVMPEAEGAGRKILIVDVRLMGIIFATGSQLSKLTTSIMLAKEGLWEPVIC